MYVSLGPRPEHGFDQPLGLLSDCHRRIEHFLRILRKIVDATDEGPLNDEQCRAVEAALTYFQTAGPRHTADEEQSLFPLLRASHRPEAQDALATMTSLHNDHDAAEPAHNEVDTLYRKWIDQGSLPTPDRAKLKELLNGLHAMYERHLAIEDKELFPLAAQALSDSELRQLGQQMAARRGLTAQDHVQPQEDSAMPIRHTIDVRTIPGPQRHPFIFRTFEGLAVNEALELVNDHDPFPLHNQFNLMKRGQFAWRYLQQGPDLWRVQISRVAPQNPKV
jgi:uncharacterized protein (DUF2249 family)/hemerythrin-like domain-containing protein